MSNVPGCSDPPEPSLPSRDLPEWRSLSALVQHFMRDLGDSKQEVDLRMANFSDTLGQILVEKDSTKQPEEHTREDVNRILLSDDFSRRVRARMTEASSSSGSAGQGPWECHTELEEHSFGEVCSLDLRRKLQRVASAGQRMLDLDLDLDLGRLQVAPPMDQRSTSRLSGIIGGSRLGGRNDLLFRLDSVDVRLLSVARSDSTLDELDALYPTGARITITNYYHDVDKDGCLVVDNPGDVTIETCFPTRLAELERLTPVQLRSLANQVFANKRYVSALELYKLSGSRPLGGTLDSLAALSKTSACQFELGRLPAAARGVQEFLELRAGTGTLVPSPACTRVFMLEARALDGMLNYDGAVKAYIAALVDCDEQQRSRILAYMVTLGKQVRGNEADDLRRYLSSGCRSADAPAFLDYVGPVDVRARDDDHGVGLFASKDIKRGQMVLVSNPIGYMQNSACTCADVYVEVLRAALSSPRIAAQLGVLWEQLLGTDKRKVPPDLIALFAPNTKFTLLWAEEIPIKVDANKIAELLRYNFRAGILGGLWTLPGLIRHTCRGNLSMVQVGRAKLFRAAEDIGTGEELSYCCTPAVELLPLAWRRQAIKCCCARCCLESVAKHLSAPYEKLTVRYSRLLQEYLRAKDVNSRSLRQLLVEEALITVADELEGMLALSTVGKMLKNVLRMSFAVSYLLYLVYGKEGDSSRSPTVPGKRKSPPTESFPNMPTGAAILDTLAASTSVSLEMIEVLSAGFFQTTLYPSMVSAKKITAADTHIDAAFYRRYGGCLPRMARANFLEWLHKSDEPDKARRA